MASDSDKRYVDNVNWRLDDQIRFFTWPDTICPQVLPADILREQSVVDKEIIFRDFLPLQELQLAKGRALLQKLKNLTPSVAARFELKKDFVENFSFRLINGEDSPERSYIAVSYCWDKKYVNQGPDLGAYGFEVKIPFKSLLFQAIIFQRMTGDEGMWIDQVCVNQTDTEEVQKAIPAMATLYRHARLVIIALEDIEVSQEEQRFLRKFIPEFENSGKDSILWRPYFGERPPFMERNPVLRKFYDKICSSRWFTRAWCSHEMRLGQKHTFLIPCTATPNKYQDTVLAFSSQFMWYLSALSSETPATSDHIRKIRDMVKDRFDIEREMEKVRRILADKPAELDAEESYTNHIREVMSLETGGNPKLEGDLRLCDARCDKISIVLNSVGNGLSLKRHGSTEALRRFSSDDECYRQLFTMALASGDPLVLGCNGPPLKIGSQGSSWMCRPTPRDTGSAPESAPLPAISTTDVTIDDSLSSQWIQLPGIVLATESKPSEECLTAAVFLVRRCQQLGLGLSPTPQHGPSQTWGPGPEYRFWRNQTDNGQSKLFRFNMTVTSVLHCGLKWMLKTAKLCGFPPNHYRAWRKDATDFFYESFELDELRELKWADSEAGRKGAESVLRFALWLIVWGQETTNAAFLGVEELWVPMIFPREDGGKALVFSQVAFSDDEDLAREPEDMAVFVPSCLVGDGYERLSRCWILNFAKKDEDLSDRLGELNIEGRKSDPNVLVRKTRVFSDGPLTGKSGWKQKDQMRIYGPR